MKLLGSAASCKSKLSQTSPEAIQSAGVRACLAAQSCHGMINPSMGRKLVIFPAPQAGLEEVMKPSELTAFLLSPTGSNFAAGGTLPVGNSKFVKAKYCQGQGLSWRKVGAEAFGNGRAGFHILGMDGFPWVL